MRIRIEKVRLELEEPFSIAHGTYRYRDSFLIGLEEDGLTGWGEAVALDYYGQTAEGIVTAAREISIYWNDRPFPGVRRFYIENKQHLQGNTFVLSAYDCAAHDLAARKEGKPWREWMGWDLPADIPPTSRTIGFGSYEAMKRSVLHWSDWPSLKVKLGAPPDMDLLKRLLEVGSTPLRVDANGSWSLSDVERAMALDAALPMELIEQPLPVEKDRALNTLGKHRIPIIADESFRTQDDLPRCFGRYDGLNIKLMKCGGLTPALELVKRAKKEGFRLMIGCMTESSFGITAAAQIASVFDFVDLDGAELLGNDPARGVIVRKGNISLPAGPGFGTGWK